MKNIIALCCLLLATNLCYGQLTWSKYTDPDHSFSILMPATPTVTNSIDTSTEMTDIGHVYITGLIKEKYLFLVSTDDLGGTSKINVDGMLKTNLTAFCTSSKTELIGSSDIMLGNSKGLKFTSKNADGLFVGRIYIIKRRLVCLAYVIKNETQADPEMEKFFNSFTVLK